MLDQDAQGPVSPGGYCDHDIPNKRTCTAICARLSSLTLTNGKLPTHEQLASHLTVDDKYDLQDGFPLGALSDIRQRQHCPICQLVLSAITDNDPQPLNHATDTNPDTNQPINLLLFPGETSLRLSHPSRLGTRLSFLSSSPPDISAPDSARLVTNNAQVNPSQILSWLRKCEQHHGAKCYPRHLADQEQDKQQQSRRQYDTDRFNEAATSNFRVIDLEGMCIVPQALDARYVALSYVWGQGTMVRLTRGNFAALSRRGGLRGEVMGQLPRTITDAMEFVRGLGVRYLWVDALCLVQDDEEDVELGMEVMNSVYQGSGFTVIAAEGADAEAGLPGVGPGSRRGVRQEVVGLGQRGGGLRMTVQHSIDWHLRRSVYKSRGWTLQELVLPRRTVVFVNQMVYFRCQEANWAEETTADVVDRYLDPDDGNISRIPDPLAEGGVRSWWAYQKLMEEYSTREIRFDGDALRASAGLLRPLCAGMETRMLEGLLANYLDNALLFVSSKGDMRRRKGFASYSWAGWEGRVMWPRENYVRFDEAGKRTWEVDNLFRWFAGRTFINWSYLSVNAHQQSLMRDYGDPSRLGRVLEGIAETYPHLRESLLDSFNPRATGFDSIYSRGGGSGPFYPNWRLDRGKRAWNHAAFDLANGQAEYARLVRNVYRAGSTMEYLTIQNWIASRGAHTVRERGGREPPRPKSIGRFSEKLHYRFRHDEELKKPREDKREQTAKMSSAYQKDPDMVIAKFPPYAVLYFQTISLSLTLGQPPDESKKQPQPSGTTSSFQRIPGIPLLSATSEVVGSLHADNLDRLPAPGSSVECILMSHCQALTWNSALGHGARAALDPETHEAARVGDDEPLELFWALYIVWKDGIAERRGVAQLLATAVGKALGHGPEIKEILLG
ncbi:heterokaryon incompatibility protein-domain-containing protein [Coniochaeta sp. 2T2.1]|nr:heterokaryon incompatibility protein-domain-containing protein [Coniochaeta sp. 2T2.1]